MSAPADSVQNDINSDLAAAQGNASAAQADLSASVKDFNPPQNPNLPFTDQAPKDHFNEIVGLSPLLMALGAVGSKFGNVHGIGMLQSTNAMMKGMVQGSADQYSDARQQYDNKYAEWKDQNRTWNDSYKAYLSAYKGRIDAQARAVQGANASVGILEKQKALSEKQVTDQQKISAQIEELHNRMSNRDKNTVINGIKADTQKERAATAEKESDIKRAQLEQHIKTADSNELTATSRSLKAEADTLLKQYPASAGKRPPEVDIKLNSLRDQMDIVNDKMKEHQEHDYNSNKSVYDQARQAIAAGGDAAKIKERIASLGLNPDNV